MLRSLYSGVSGLRNHQARMDVIGNNISNVNTYGYKSGRAVFQDIFSQTTRAASAAGANLGGTNPMQIGLGMSLSAVDLMMNGMSAFERTDRALDLMIEGDGFFIVRNGNEQYYTRAGNFYLDNEGNLTTSGGLNVMGIVLATPELLDGFDETTAFPAPGTVTEADLEAITVDPEYYDLKIDSKGIITAVSETDGETYVLGAVITANFQNPSGVNKVGNSMYSVSGNSGAPRYGRPGDEGVASLSPGGLEMSDVDLSQEFTSMIVTQRGFQANSRIITVSDTLIEELVNLKR